MASSHGALHACMAWHGHKAKTGIYLIFTAPLHFWRIYGRAWEIPPTLGVFVLNFLGSRSQGGEVSWHFVVFDGVKLKGREFKLFIFEKLVSSESKIIVFKVYCLVLLVAWERK